MKEAIKAAIATIVGAFLIVLLADTTLARWKPEYASRPQAVRDWYDKASLTASAQERLGFVRCCKESEVVRAQFRVDRAAAHGADQWWWLDGDTWKRIPDDIIHWGEHAPDGRPTLFVLDQPFLDWPAGTPTCFWPPLEGG
jgi:hypothetical protein